MFLGMHFLYFLVCLFVGLVLSLVLIVVGGTEVIHTFGASPESDFGPIEFLCLLFGFISLYSYASVWIKRLHDLDKSGWDLLWMFVPFGGLYLFIICGFQLGTQSPNHYGLRAARGINIKK